MKKNEEKNLINPADLESLELGEKEILKELKKARLDNRKIEKSDSLSKKIEKYIEKHSLDCSIDYVYKKMEEDDGIVASIFEKEPLKQNFVEKWIFNTIKTRSGLNDSDCVNFPSSTKNFMINGKLETSNETDDSMKSIDFKFTKNGIEYYCSQKYTTTSGSNQDDRFSELLHFVRSNKCKPKNPKHVIVALADGSYFKKRASKYRSDSSCFKYLKDIAGECKVMTYLQFIDFLKEN